MAQRRMSTVTTESIESSSKVTGNFEVFDFFFLLIYTFITIALSSYVHEKLTIAYYIFSAIMAVFLTAKSPFNKYRRNYESIYFMLTRDTTVYIPYYRENGEDM